MYVLVFCLQFLLCASAFMVLASKNPVHSVLFLVLVFCNGAGLLLLGGLEFLALIFLVVYVGAIAVLFLFIVMMLNLKIIGFRQSLLNHYPVSLVLLGFLLLEMAYGLLEISWGIPLFSLPLSSWAVSLNGHDNIHLLGNFIYTYGYLAFLVSGLLLLVAMVASIFLTLDPLAVPSSRRQDIFLQVSRSSSLRLFRFPIE